MTSRSDFGADSHIRFPSNATLERFDECLVAYYAKTRGTPPLLLDFSACNYIDLAVLFNLVSVFVRRKQKGQSTFIGIPREKRVRDFLRVWRFPEAFWEATSTIFEDTLLEEDLHYRGEKQTTYTGLGTGLDALTYDRDWTGSEGKRNFFEFTTYPLKAKQRSLFRGPHGAIPRLEAQRWNNSLIREVLHKHLISQKSADDVARVLIYESVSNAVRHPQASVIQTTSIFQKPNTRLKDSAPQFKKGTLRIFIWDDGEAISETLLPLVRSNRPIRSYIFDRYMYDTIYVELQKHGDKQKQNTIADQYENPKRDAAEEFILLSSLYPGVTRTLSETTPQVDPIDYGRSVELQKWADQQGMGLYALTRTGLDIHQGSLLIRSGSHELRIAVASDRDRKRHGVRYRAKIVKFPRSIPRFKGNLLIVQLPIRLL